MVADVQGKIFLQTGTKGRPHLQAIGEGSRSLVHKQAVTFQSSGASPSRPLLSSLPSAKVRAGTGFGLNERSEEKLAVFRRWGIQDNKALPDAPSGNYQLTVAGIRHRLPLVEPSGCNVAPTSPFTA